MSLNVDDIMPMMVNAARKPLQAYWHDVQPFVTEQLTSMGDRLKQIAADVDSGELTVAEAESLFKVEKDNAVCALAAGKGMTEVAAQSAINSALDAVSGVLVGALHFPLPI